VTRKIAILTAAALGLMGCEPRDEGVKAEIPDEPLSGTIDGAPWSYHLGLSDPFLASDDEWFVHVSDQDIDCDRIDGGSALLFRLPAHEGEWEITDRDEFVFYVQATGQSHQALEGVIRVDRVTNDHIDGALMARIDDAFDVAGTFTVLRCTGI